MKRMFYRVSVVAAAGFVMMSCGSKRKAVTAETLGAERVEAVNVARSTGISVDSMRYAVGWRADSVVVSLRYDTVTRLIERRATVHSPHVEGAMSAVSGRHSRTADSVAVTAEGAVRQSTAACERREGAYPWWLSVAAGAVGAIALATLFRRMGCCGDGD